MSRMFQAPLLHAALLAAIASGAHAAEFVYQGQLDDRGVPANGRYDLRIAAYGDEKSAAGLMTPIEFPAVEVKDGRFELRFDAPLARAREAWLEVAVRDVGAGNFATIPGRSKAISAPLIGACWSSTGDAGSDAATNFLGTTDDEPLVLRTGNVQSLRIEPNAIPAGGTPFTANVIAGSSANHVTAGVRGATIAGGGAPDGDADPDAWSEAPNSVTDHFGTVSGGLNNHAGSDNGVVADALFASVGGGSSNVSSGTYSTVAGGYFNTASGSAATVGGGLGNCAGGVLSWAGGRSAMVRKGNLSGSAGFACASVTSSGDDDGDEGAFVWADSQSNPLESTGPNQFLVRADGGAIFNRNTLVATPIDDFVIGTRSVASGADASVHLRLVTRAGTSASMSVGEGTGTIDLSTNELFEGADRLRVFGASGGVATLTNGGVWTSASSRTFKHGFQPVDANDMLARVLDLDISRWQYIGSGEGEHVGPMAEDFHAAFGLGRSDKQIATVDADGVALAAIQGLNAKLEAENAALREDNAAIRSELDALRELVESRLSAEH